MTLQALGTFWTHKNYFVQDQDTDWYDWGMELKSQARAYSMQRSNWFWFRDTAVNLPNIQTYEVHNIEYIISTNKHTNVCDQYIL